MAPCSSGKDKAVSRLRTLLYSTTKSDLPLFLCPAFVSPPSKKSSFSTSTRPRHTILSRARARTTYRSLHTQSPQENGSVARPTIPQFTPQLPQQCPGCGALSQTTNKHVAGYYNTSRKAVRDHLSPNDPRKAEQAQTLDAAMANLDPNLLASLDLDPSSTTNRTAREQTTLTLICDRCHQLQYHREGVSIHHPSVQSIADTILETPYKYNHVYHVIDAADFPMSLISGIHKALHLTPQRSLNRRASSGGFYHGKKMDMSFIITRSDLLAPLKSQVDHMMPYFIEVLRDALGSYGQDVRLGNVRCVSAKRGWWTTNIKEEVWQRGGGGWMVGKVNVGKSQLLESIFPKGRRKSSGTPHVIQQPLSLDDTIKQESPAYTALDESALLPPAPTEVDYPAMPLVSSLPGTTASPIRLLFGGGKGELVDMPGTTRGDLELHVQPEYRQSLVMKSRVTPEQQVIKPGQSLLLGGLIRITPITPDTVFLAYPFMPIAPHVTSTEKAVAIQARERETTVENITLPEVNDKITSAGKFQLKWDVTKSRSGPLTRKDDVGLKPDILPYTVYAGDILIEGCGWVEITAQVRKRQVEGQEQLFPQVEIFSPYGKYLGIRKPMNAWLLNHKVESVNAKGRPRRSMKGMKKKMKLAVRAKNA